MKAQNKENSLENDQVKEKHEEKEEFEAVKKTVRAHGIVDEAEAEKI